jgi:hypothetical protein
MPLQATSGAASYDAFGGGVPFEPIYIEQVFQNWLYTGNGSTQTINNGIDLAGKGGLVWVKKRSGTQAHALFDTARGVNNYLVSNATIAQNGYGVFTDTLTAFNSTGFSLGADASAAFVNDNGATFASWTFRKQPKFFDVVTYTGDGVAGRTVAHNLGAVPGVIIVKPTSGVGGWFVYHRSLGATQYIQLDSTGAAGTASLWNNTAPTDSVFSLGSQTGMNGSGTTFVAYLFAHNAGGFGLTGTDNVISCGSFTGSSGSVNLGYEPQWILVKQSNGTNGWRIFDNMRGWTVGPAKTTGNAILFANTSDAEIDGPGYWGTPTATGFDFDTGGGNYIYIAIRRGPMKVPTTGTSVFAPVAYTGTGSARNLTGLSNPTDLFFATRPNNNAGRGFFDRLRGRFLEVAANTSDGETTNTNSVTSFALMDGVSVGSASAVNNTFNYISYHFRRAPSFFDEVCYTGNGVDPGQIITHNLGVFPQLIIAKSRSTGANWPVSYSSDSSFSDAATLGLNLTSGNLPSGLGGQVFGLDSTTFYAYKLFGDMAASNAAGVNYVAYLFATCPGVSKVGSYTGTGTTQTINCGFTAGSRFVLIKRTDASGDWYVWDSARGIVAGNDPYLLLNSTAAQVTNTDFIDTAATGFEISSTAPAAINANGGSYIFLAIA